MFHTIEFAAEGVVDLEGKPSEWLKQMVVGKGMRIRAELRPHIVEMPDGPVEVADLFFDDGTTARDVPYERFSFVE